MSADKPPTFRDVVHGWAFKRFGVPGLVVLALLGAGFYVWSNWSDVRSWPGVSSIADYLAREDLPKADRRRFSVAVAHLEDDTDGALEQLVVRLLDDFEGVQVLRFDRTISTEGGVPEEREKEGHETARGYLEESGASVLIWGRVLSHAGKAVPDLYLTSARGEPGQAKQYSLESETDFRLPQLFWYDLSSVLRLIVITRAAAIDTEDGHYVADRLRPFIARVRSLLAGATGQPGWDAESIASTRVILADALLTYGKQAGENEPLEEAVAAYKAALEEWTRDRVPLQWAMTQNNLGAALARMGERESGTSRLEESVVAFKAALEVHTRDRVPLDWAMTQNNLGNALNSLGDRKSGTVRLEEAVAAYETALEEWTRDRVPLDWAGTQNNLGNALSDLGVRESGTSRLEAAVAAYKAALEERTRDRVPLDWATTQNNLGNALSDLGVRESGTSRLEAAVAAYKAALEEWTRDRVPLQWAMTQNNLGAALSDLGERESGTSRLEEAVAAYKAALEVFEDAQASYYVSGTRGNLEIVQALIEERRRAGK